MRAIFFLAISALAQTSAPPAFDVASVKINRQFNPDDRASWLSSFDRSAATLTARNFNLTMLVAWAWDVERPQISGPPGFDSQRYDILAKAAAPVDDAEMRQMLRTLLAERFHLAVHRETRPMDVLALIVPKGGHKMTVSSIAGPTGHRDDPVLGNVVQGATLPALAADLSHELPMPVIDMTGLTGRFDFPLNVQKYVSALRARMLSEPHPPPDSEARVMLMQDVIAGELGLRLEQRRAPVEIIVIDHAEKSPVEN